VNLQKLLIRFLKGQTSNSVFPSLIFCRIYTSSHETEDKEKYLTKGEFLQVLLDKVSHKQKYLLDLYNKTFNVRVKLMKSNPAESARNFKCQKSQHGKGA
jgi:hypothetical protein